MAGAGRCLVTGAGGFIGAALVQRLAGEYDEVWRLVRPASSGPAGGIGGAESTGREAPRTLIADLGAEVPQLDGLAPFDAIFHLAGRAHQSDRPATEERDHEIAQVTATRHLLCAAAANGARRVIFTSSVAVMGVGVRDCLDETAPPSPAGVYGRSKLRAESLVLETGGSGRPENVVLRLPLVYGPGQKGNLDRLLRAIVRRRFPPPPRSPNRRSVLHVADAVEALRLAARHPAAAGRVYLVCEPEPASTRAIYEWSLHELGRRPPRFEVPAPAWRALGRVGDLAAGLLGRRVGFDSIAVERLLGDAWYSAARIERELGWRAGRRLRDELPELLPRLAGPSGDRKSRPGATR